MEDKTIYTAKYKFYKVHHDCMVNPEAANSMLEHLVEYIGMRKIPEELTKSKNPDSFLFTPEVVELDEMEIGVTGTVKLFESHIAFHGWSKLNMAYVVICSCKAFDIYLTLQYLSGYLKSTDYSYGTIIL